MRARNESIGIDAVLLAVYFALTPMHQTLVLSNGGTVVKYLAFAVMLACVAQGYIESGRFIVIWDLIWPVLAMLGWFALSVIWADSRSSAISSLVSVGSYCALMLIVGSRRWNEKERRLFLAVMILSCVYYSFTLIRFSATVKRATLSFFMEEAERKDADQNALACNIGFGALVAFYVFLKREKGAVKWAGLLAMLMIVAGIVSTGSRGGLLAVCAGMVCLTVKQAKADVRLRNHILLFIGGALLVYWLVFDLNILNNAFLVNRFKKTTIGSLSTRVEIWEQYLGMLFSRPIGFLCGYGFGCDTIAHAAYMGRDWLRASHNDCLSILSQVGVPGLMLIGAFIRHIWRKSRSEGFFLGCACIVLAFVSSMDINFFKTYGWWNAMLIAYIGSGGLPSEA